MNSPDTDSATASAVPRRARPAVAFSSKQPHRFHRDFPGHTLKIPIEIGTPIARKPAGMFR
jgi:hypothetical protein